MIAALVPVKALSAAKGRLAELLSDDERRRLALAMLEDVLRALAAVDRIDTAAVVSPDADVLARARDLGARPIEEPSSSRGVNQALTLASRRLAGDGAGTLLVLAADLPAARPADLDALLDALADTPGIALAPTSDRGTGALALRPPGLIPFRYGRHSSVLHKREAAARGLSAAVLHLNSLANDVDQPDDLAALLAAPSDGATRRLLAEIRVAERLGATTA